MWKLFTNSFRRQNLICFLVLCVTFVGCKDDDLQKQVDELEQRVITLETLCAQMNTNISSIQTIIEALKQQDYITGVNPVEENTVVIGYTITFAKNKPITIYNGEKGSFLGTKKDSDGVYYWVLDGNWLLDDDGEKMQVSGVTPQLKIEDGHWLVSVDEGKTWDDAGEATGDSFFKEVDYSADDFVRFVFADGTEVQVPKKETFAISFSEPLPLKITAGETVQIAYTLSQGDEKTLVKTITSNGWKASVEKRDNLSGTISITAPTPITDDEILVFISDGKEKTAMSAISFCIVILENVQDNTVKVSGGEGNLDLEITSNMEIKAVPKNEWIVLDEQPLGRSLVTNNFHFAIQANDGEQNRTGYIEIQDMGGKVLKTITVIQGNALEEEIAKEREALIALYHATKGDQWKNNTNWCSDKPVGEWYGIETDYRGVIYSINLDENELSGVIPLEIGNLGNLQWLSLSINQLFGEIPSSIGQLKELTTLHLANNQLSGNIPVELGDLTNLITVYLYNNQLSGNIPSSIGNLKELDGLWLENNQLTGIIPIEIGNLCNLTSLRLFDNQLSGEIPTSIVGMKNLAGLELQNNKVKGLIPNTICQLSNLKYLNLANNHFSGDIPENIGNLHALENLNLGHNQLTGAIPVSIKQCSNLQYIDLSSNQLQGDMMLDYFSCKKDIKNLYLDHNNLTGTIPAEFATWLNDYPRRLFNFTYNCLSGSLSWEFISHFNWLHAEVCIIPQNVGYNLEVPILYESKDYSEDGKVVTLQKSTDGNGVNIIISGDGFADIDFVNGHFDDVMNKTMEALFSLEPMKSFRNLFNVYAVKAVSKNNVFIEGCETAFSSDFQANNPFVGISDVPVYEKYGPQVENFDRLRHVFIIIVNAYARLGTTYQHVYNDGESTSSIMVCGLENKEPAVNNPEAFRNILCHEFGHAFGHLADEYWYQNTALPLDEIQKKQILKYHSWGMDPNIDVTNDPNEVMWKHFIADERYRDENIGVFEGGYLCNEGVWRATENSIMRWDFYDATFNAPSREAIYKRIMKQAYGDDWQYDYEKFVEYDAINRSSVPKLLRRVNTPVIPKDYKPLPPPVIIRK